MSDIVIGFGGTGAKMVQAFLMMGAAGALQLEKPVKILLVDQDKTNGNTLRTVEILERYLEVKRLMTGGSPQPLTATFETYPTTVWQPLTQLNEQLGKYFEYDAQSQDRDASSRLLETLYGREQIRASLDHGFLGNPNIGAPVFAEAIKFDRTPWNRLGEDIAKGLSEGGSRIVLCGSVFGGTGAAGIPNVAKLLRQRHRPQGAADHARTDETQPKIILNIAMPYFSIRQVEGAAVQASGKDFLPNSKAALQYYHDQKYLDFCDALFVLGENDMAPLEKAFLGDREQLNPAHPVEMFAACNIAHALSRRAGADLEGKLILTAREQLRLYRWQDLPLPNSDFIRAHMGAFARFCFALLCYRQAFDNYRASNKTSLEWLHTFFPEGKHIDVDALNHLNRLAALFLEWAGQMERTAESMPGGYKADWFNWEPIVHGEPSRLETVLKPLGPDSIGNLPNLLLPLQKDERLNERDLLYALNQNAKQSSSKGFGGLINTLYATCGRTLKGFEPAAAAARGGAR